MTYDEEKFRELNRMLTEARQNGVDEIIVARADALGDDYEEVIENLTRIGEAGLALRLVVSR